MASSNFASASDSLTMKFFMREPPSAITPGIQPEVRPISTFDVLTGPYYLILHIYRCLEYFISIACLMLQSMAEIYCIWLRFTDLFKRRQMLRLFLADASAAQCSSLPALPHPSSSHSPIYFGKHHISDWFWWHWMVVAGLSHAGDIRGFTHISQADGHSAFRSSSDHSFQIISFTHYRKASYKFLSAPRFSYHEFAIYLGRLRLDYCILEALFHEKASFQSPLKDASLQ